VIKRFESQLCSEVLPQSLCFSCSLHRKSIYVEEVFGLRKMSDPQMSCVYKYIHTHFHFPFDVTFQ